MKSECSTFCKRLKFARQIADLTQAQLAKKAGTTTTTVSNYENPNNIKNASFHIVVRLANVLDVSLDWLGGKGSIKDIVKED